MTTHIEWTDETWNPTVGCRRVGVGCEHCYAERMTARLEAMGRAEYAGLLTDAGRFNGAVRTVPAALERPLHWRKPRRVFVNSMSDLFHEAVPDDYIARAFAVMAACPQHTFQVLTKRPERMREWFTKTHAFSDLLSGMPIAGSASELMATLGWATIPDLEERIAGATITWPLPNVWLGVSASTQAEVEAAVPVLLQTPAAVRFLSLEPLVEAVDIGKYIGYYPMYETVTQGRASLRSREKRRVEDRYERTDLESCSPARQSVGEAEPNSQMQETQSREQHRGIPPNSSDVRRDQVARIGSQTCVETCSRPNSPGADDQSQGRKQDEQCSAESGASDVFRADQTCPSSIGQNEPARREKQSSQADGSGSSGNTPPSQSWGQSQEYRGSVQGIGPHDLQDSARTEMGISWLICGGESGPGARPMHPDWVRALRDQCVAAGVPYFFKQWGAWAPFNQQRGKIAQAVNGNSDCWGYWQDEYPGDDRFSLRGLTSHTESQMVRVGKKPAGAMLDGREWREFPKGIQR